MKKITSIHDIAAHLKVSATTISFVLNGKSREKKISLQMEEKINAYINQIGYKPNLLAKSLRTGKTGVLAMLVEDISDPFFSSIARGIEKRIQEYGYSIFFSSTENDILKTKNIMNALRGRVDGYIIAPPPGLETEIVLLKEENIPVVLFDRYFKKIATNNVVVDNFNGVYEGVLHLKKNGYLNIGFITLESEQLQMADRLNGFQLAMQNWPGNAPVLAVDYSSDPAAATVKIEKFITENDPDALFFSTNYLAITGLDILSKLKKSIPTDVGVIGFDDNIYFSLFSPSITVVEQPVEAIAQEVVRKIFQCLKGKDVQEEETIVLPTTLVIRNSTLSKSEVISVLS